MQKYGIDTVFLGKTQVSPRFIKVVNYNESLKCYTVQEAALNLKSQLLKFSKIRIFRSMTEEMLDELQVIYLSQ